MELVDFAPAGGVHLPAGAALRPAAPSVVKVALVHLLLDRSVKVEEDELGQEIQHDL